MNTEAIATTDQPSAHDPGAMLTLAIQRGVDADQLGKLMKLYEQRESSLAEKAYARAMNACQGEMPAIVKAAENKHTKSRYAKLDDIKRVITPIYSANGFSLSFGEGVAKLEGDVRVICDVIHVDGHTKQYWLDGALDNTGTSGSVTKTDIQGKASTISYLQRYLIVGIFNLNLGGQDNDGNRQAPVPQRQPEPEPIDKAAFDAMLKQKGWNYQGFLEALDRKHGTSYARVNAVLVELRQEHLRDFRDWLMTQPNAPAPTPASPPAQSDPVRLHSPPIEELSADTIADMFSLVVQLRDRKGISERQFRAGVEELKEAAKDKTAYPNWPAIPKAIRVDVVKWLLKLPNIEDAR